ncbi:hypothetical protein DYB26_015467 [Aphanomyces astaci]|uniref:Uncharacterized protein n=1 Tax=Aphanomyces astaci TaxID=112090 RepID=A0A397DPK6_APHAT|nr:hypothetical protein DYB36_005314 [Aphanomyces astaci]RHY66122.1 hypothetical protein DYB38_006477 [Aphanomyces astaci]RHY85076.1 hypothetical protein DYB26_015467 [Aphanomyces astaci]RHY88484.1 hypothetical protein DYB31_002942 [Aphanomyces astaci]
MVNPLTRCLEDYSLPPFATLRVSDIVPAVRAAIAEMALDVNAIEDDLSDPDADISWATVMDRLEIIDDPVNRLWRIVIHLSSVADSPELRLAQSEVQAEVLTIQSRRAQSVPVFRAMQRLRASRGFHEDLTAEQQSNRFDSNVLDSTNAFSYLVHDKAEMDGLPDAIVALTANNAVAAGHDLATATQGPWKFTLDWSLYWAVQRYATSRRLRETIYLANQAIASAAPFDNAPIMQQMIQLRRDRAQLLGFESYAALGLEDKMAPSVSAVQDLIDGMRNKFRPLGEAEVADVSAYAASQGAVLDGLFEFVARLFGLRIEAADTPQETWHPDVQYYQIRALDQPGTPVISQFYLDLYERGDEKKAGAWIEVMVGRSSVLRTDDKAHVRIPVFALMFNFATPVSVVSRPGIEACRSIHS